MQKAMKVPYENNTKDTLVGPWTLAGRALVGPLGLMGRALIGQALVGQALTGFPGPS